MLLFWKGGGVFLDVNSWFHNKREVHVAAWRYSCLCAMEEAAVLVCRFIYIVWVWGLVRMCLPLVIGLHVCMWLVISIKWNLIDWYIFIYESIWLWGVLLFLIYSVWTKFVLIDKKGKSSYSTLKENDNGNFLGGNGVVSDRGQLHIMTGSQEVFGKHLLGQKCFSIWGWGVWLSF